MVGRAEGRRRVAVVLETDWDRKQLAACRERWEAGIDVAFPPPDDVACPSDFDPLAFVEAAASGALGGIEGVTSASDYPGATVAAAIATRLGLPGPRPERVIEASHKYYSRVAQRRAAPEAVPAFGLLDPRRPDAPPPIPFPLFAKPVKGAFSVLARRIDDAAGLHAYLSSAAVREFTGDYLEIFNRLVAALTDFEIDGRWMLAESLLRGDLVTVEGFEADGEIRVFGVVDSALHPGGSFARFDYPSRLPAAVQEQMADVARRVVGELRLEQSLWNIEMVHDPASGSIGLVEVNPRICGQFADLYQKVDGTNTYETALALCTGTAPRLERGAGRYATASSVPLRVFAPARVEAAPAAEDIAAAEALFPETLVWSECQAGDVLADFDADEDGASHRYAVLNVGGDTAEEVGRRVAAVEARLGYAMSPLEGGRP